MFPHIMYFYYASMPDPFPSDDIRQWLKDNIGSYRKDWTLIPNKTIGSPYPDLKEFWCNPYAFKSLKDATAFKLRWM